MVSINCPESCLEYYANQQGSLQSYMNNHAVPTMCLGCYSDPVVAEEHASESQDVTCQCAMVDPRARIHTGIDKLMQIDLENARRRAR